MKFKATHMISAAAMSLSYLAFTGFAFAETKVQLCPTGDQGQTGGNFSNLCGLDPANAIPFLFTTVIIIAIVIALFYLIWGGIKWILSGGDKAKVDAARSTIVAAIVGLIIIFLAWFIINLVLQFFLGGNAKGGFTIPTIPSANP